jgi:hypothetical protein
MLAKSDADLRLTSDVLAGGSRTLRFRLYCYQLVLLLVLVPVLVLLLVQYLSTVVLKSYYE